MRVAHVLILCFRPRDDLPPFVNEPPKRMGSWQPVDKPTESTQKLIGAVARLKDHGLKGEHIIRTWLEQRVLPLVARATPMYAYMGREDPT